MRMCQSDSETGNVTLVVSPLVSDATTVSDWEFSCSDGFVMPATTVFVCESTVCLPT
jgi:hypothetical protein